MPVTILNPHRSEPWAHAVQGLSGALEAFTRYKSEDREHKLRMEEVARRREESESMRKFRDMQMQEFEDDRERRAQQENIQKAGETQALLSDFIKRGGLGPALPDFGPSKIATDIAQPGQQAPTMELPGTQAPQPTAEAAAPALAAIEQIGELGPGMKYQARQIQARQAEEQAIRRRRAEAGDVPVTPELLAMLPPGLQAFYGKQESIPQAMLVAAQKPVAQPAVKEVDLGNRVVGIDDKGNEVWSRAKGAAPGAGEGSKTTKAVYDKVSKENVMRTDSQIAAEPERYIAPRAGATTGEGGKPLLATEINKVSEFVQGLESLKNLGKGATGTGAIPGAAVWIPNWFTEFTGWGASAKSRQAMLDTAKQIIGKAMEGGVLRKEDESKYKKILPTINDAPEVARNKMTQLGDQMARDSRLYLQVLEKSGRDVSNIKELFTEYGYDVTSGGKQKPSGPSGDEILFGPGGAGSRRDPGGLR